LLRGVICVGTDGDTGSGKMAITLQCVLLENKLGGTLNECFLEIWS